MQFTGIGQIVFDSSYTTGYHTNKSSNVISEADSNYVFVNYTIDSATNRWDMGLLRINKNGNELIKNSFNMFNQSYFSFVTGMKNFIEATPNSYFLSGGYSDGNTQTFILNKFSKTTLDTLKTVIYHTNTFHAAINFVKLHDNKYFLVGNTGNSVSQAPFFFQLDSNLNILQTSTLSTSNNFGLQDALYNPVNKKILLTGGTPTGQYPNTFIYIDTLGAITQTAFSSRYLDRGIFQVFYRSLDSSYIAVGYLKTGVYGNNDMIKLCIGKYDINLNLKWEKTYGDAMLGNGIMDAVILNDGSIVAVGVYSPLTTLPLMNANENGIILKVDKDGNFVWAREYDHVAPGYLIEQFYGIDKTLDKGFIVCGNVLGPPSTKSKAWAVKTDSMGCVSPNCVSSTMLVTNITYPSQPVDTTTHPVDTTKIDVGVVEINYSKSKLRIYPNPTSQFLKVELILPTAEKKEYQLIILNAFGQRILNSKTYNTFTEIEVSTLKTGIYFLQIFDKEILIASEKFVKE